MLKQFTRFAVISSLLFSTAVQSTLELKAEENNTGETSDEIIEEPVEEVTEEPAAAEGELKENTDSAEEKTKITVEESFTGEFE